MLDDRGRSLVTRLAPEILALDVVTTGGASRTIQSLYVRVDDPRELCDRLLELSAPQAGDDWHCEDG